MVIPSGSPVCDYNNPGLYTGAFPELFPYGIGGPDVKRRVGLSLEKYAEHAMKLADSRFREHSIFPFVLFNVLQRHRVSQGASQSMRLGCYVDLAEHLDHLSGPALETCLKDLQQAQRRGKFPSVHDCKDIETRSALGRMFRELNTIGGRLPLTDSSKRTARNEMYAMMIRHGLPDFFITINPMDVNSTIVCHLAGVDIDIGIKSPEFPANTPKGRHRKVLVARDPHAAVLYSYTLMEAFINALVGFENDTGVLGPVEWYHFNPEEQGRGALHYHGEIGLKFKPSPTEFAALLKTPDFQARIITYLDGVISQQPPALCPSGNIILSRFSSV
jgi:hypothetical protein